MRACWLPRFPVFPHGLAPTVIFMPLSVRLFRVAQMSPASASGWIVRFCCSICRHALESVQRRIPCMLSALAEVDGSPTTAFSTERTSTSLAFVLLHEAPVVARHSMVHYSRCRMTTTPMPPFLVLPVAELSLQMQWWAGQPGHAPPPTSSFQEGLFAV